ncbi:family 43 glycosylhydrolase [Streptomyces sp. NPDC088812]|uniref:family 43 glycosylhydrolase n=1 Tax=Streptomyces sp. NPDC088812 TaxID=3365905 RepID=UPI00380E49CC
MHAPRPSGPSRRSVLAGAAAGTAATALGVWNPDAAQAAGHRTPSFATIQNDHFWLDTDGNPIYSQGGGVFKFGDTYYWYGVRYTGAEPYQKNPTRLYDKEVVFLAITCYSSHDLVHWTFENNIATTATALDIPTSKDVSGDTLSRMRTLADTSWLGRLGVVYNPNTRKYVLVTQMKSTFDANPTGRALLFLQSDTPTGEFRYADIQTHVENCVSQGTGDQTVFTDDDGQSYLVFSNAGGRQYSYVSRIAAADSLSIEPAKQVGYVAAGREGNAMFKLDGHYYIGTSDLHGWNSSHTYLIRSRTDDILGEYSAESVLPGTERDYSHVTQTGFFVTVKGRERDTVVFAGDRWADFAWNGIGYNQWMPLSSGPDGLVFHSLSQWRLDARSGRWEVGPGNNYLLNPEFAADRVPVTQPTGWVVTADEDSASQTFVSNTSPGAGGSRFAITLGAAEAFSGSLSQTVDVPRGTYRFAATVRSTGGFTYARIRITSPGRRKPYIIDLNRTTDGWQDVALDGLRLTSKEVTVSIEARGPGGTSALFVDSLSLVRERR